MNIDYKLIGSRIKEARKSTGMTQEKLAEALSVSVGYVSQVERGYTKISLDLLGEISGILNCKIEYLVAGSSISQEEYLGDEIIKAISSLNNNEKKFVYEFLQLFKKGYICR